MEKDIKKVQMFVGKKGTVIGGHYGDSLTHKGGKLFFAQVQMMDSTMGEILYDMTTRHMEWVDY